MSLLPSAKDLATNLVTAISPEALALENHALDRLKAEILPELIRQLKAEFLPLNIQVGGGVGGAGKAN